MRALVVAAIYLIPFLALGWFARRWAKAWIDSRGIESSESLRAQAGPRREPRRLFLLGSWRTEDPN
jgi:hypothetical protein